MDFECEDRFRDLTEAEAERILAPPVQARRSSSTAIGTKLIEEMGVETLMWGSDYPHPTASGRKVVEVHRGAVRRSAGRDRPQDHLRERRASSTG